MSVTNRIQEMGERILGIEDTKAEIDKLVRKNVKFKNL